MNIDVCVVWNLQVNIDSGMQSHAENPDASMS